MHILRSWPVWKLILIFLSLLLAGSVYISGIVVRNYESDFLLKLQKENLDRAFSLLVATSITPIITEDIPLLETIIDETVKSTPQIHALRFENEDHELLKEWLAPNQATFFPPLVLDNQILYENESFGKLTISWNLDQTQLQIENHVENARILVAALLLMMSLMVLILFHIIFVRPLNIIYEQLSALTNEDKVNYIELNISREFFRLGSTVNRFSDYLIERKRFLSEIKEINQNLLEAYEELKNTQLHLVQSAKLASLGEISTSIAHELKNPLGTILLTAEMGEMCIEDKKYDDVNPLFEQIIHQTQRATSIINHMRKYGRDASKSDKKLIPVDSLVDNSLILLRKQLSTNNIKLSIEIPENLQNLYCNEIQIEQVITNLVNNARDAMENSEIKNLCIRASKEDQKIIIEVEDTAGGMPADVLSNIFESYFTTKSENKGTGLGLSISQNIVKEHGGELTVKSKVGIGSIFKIALPLTE